MQLTATANPRGTLTARKLNAVVPAPAMWTLQNRLTRRYLSGALAYTLARFFSWFTDAILGTRIVTITAELGARKRTWFDDAEREPYLRMLKAGDHEGAELYARSRTYWIDYGVISRRMLTDAGVAYIVDDFDNGAGGADISNFNFHGCGTGTNAEAAGDTALQSESTTVLNPDSTRATGTRSQPAANQYRSSGTLTFDGSAAITEHGLFTTSGVGTGTLLDRSQFAAINVSNGDSISFQYTLTLNSGG